MTRDRSAVSQGTPFVLAELMAWIRALGPYRWASSRLRGWGVTGRTAVTSVPYLLESAHDRDRTRNANTNGASRQ